MRYDNLNDDNFILYAIKHYDNKQCLNTEEFHEDLKRIKYLKKLFTRYELTGDLKERLILNHIIILNNMFGPTPLVRILFLKMKNQLHFLKPFLVFLNIMPEVVYNIGKDRQNFFVDDIPLDSRIVAELRKI